MTNATSATRQWRFFRAGGFDQVKLETGADLMALDQLDLKLWVALACPASGLEFDKATLALIDTDKDGRIRAPELIAAVKWAGSLLKNPDDLLKGAPMLPLAAINDADPHLTTPQKRSSTTSLPAWAPRTMPAENRALARLRSISSLPRPPRSPRGGSKRKGMLRLCRSGSLRPPRLRRSRPPAPRSRITSPAAAWLPSIRGPRTR